MKVEPAAYSAISGTLFNLTRAYNPLGLYYYYDHDALVSIIIICATCLDGAHSRNCGLLRLSICHSVLWYAIIIFNKTEAGLKAGGGRNAHIKVHNFTRARARSLSRSRRESTIQGLVRGPSAQREFENKWPALQEWGPAIWRFYGRWLSTRKLRSRFLFCTWRKQRF